MNNKAKKNSTTQFKFKLGRVFSNLRPLSYIKTKPAKTISVIIPAYNEAKNLPILVKKLKKIFLAQPRYKWEIVIVNDGSRDDTDRVCRKLAQSSIVKYIELSRNFGKEIATTAGIHSVNSAAAILIDADLQHPPELIPEFVQSWESGYEIVVGIRKYDHRDNFLKRLSSKLFYKLINLVSSDRITPSSSDFRLIDRKVIGEFKRFTERNRLTRGLLDWMGFKTDQVYFTSPLRRHGQPGYTPLKLFKLALDTLIGHSNLPLRLAGYLGVLITVISGSLGLFMFVTTYIFNDYFNFNFSGPAGLAVLNLFLVGVILVCLGLISLYIGNIHDEVSNRPIYVIRSTTNIDDGQKT